jgi:succinyl-CoA synthetase alpha subunit
MSIIVNKNSKVLVQGITGSQGRFHARSMLNYGTSVVAGVTPGRGGQTIEGVPVYDKVADAVQQRGADTSIIFVPAPAAKLAVLEALDAGIKTCIIITEGIPIWDEVEFIARAEKQGATIIGPNCPGAVSPADHVKVGIMPDHIFKAGEVGIVSRSGTLTYEIAWHVTSAGQGQSTCIGIGGDPVTGLDFVQVLERFKADRQTRYVALIGEIGGDAEERAAAYIMESKYPKPVAAYIAGRTAPEGKRMGHAGAIIMGGSGSAESKIEALEAAGVPVAGLPGDIVELLKGH